MLRANERKLAVFLSTLFLGLFLYSPTALLAEEGELLWSYPAGDDINSSPAIGSDGTIYVGSEGDSLHAINPNGSRKWAFGFGFEKKEKYIHIHSSPAIGSDGTIYVGSMDGNLYAITDEGDQGTQKWAFSTGGDVYSSPAIGSDGTIYVGSYDKKLYAITDEGGKGTLKWAFATLSYIRSSPAIGSDGTVYVGSYDDSLYAITDEGDQGARKWAFATGDDVWSSPAIGSDGTIYVGSNDDSLYAINPADGTRKWAFATGHDVKSSLAIGSDGTVYVGSLDDSLYAINPADGSRKWAFATEGKIYSSPAIGSDGTIYVGITLEDEDEEEEEEEEEGYRFYAVNPDGTQKWAFTNLGYILSSPAIGSDGTIYVGTDDKKLYAIDTGTGAGLANSPWPKFRHDLWNTGMVASIFPSTAQEFYPSGTDFRVDIDVSSVTNLFGTSFELSWDQTEYVSLALPDAVEPGPFLGEDLIPYSNTNPGTEGLLSVVVCRKAGEGVGGVDGSGTVIRVHFTSQISTPFGTEVTFSLSNVVSIDPEGYDIYLAARDLTIAITGVTVWPGDANEDAQVNQNDVFSIGNCWKASGPARPDATRLWSAQPCPLWNVSQPDLPGKDLAHADCDGNGIIDQADVLPIGLNWNKIHDGAATMLASAAALPDAASAGLGDALQTSLNVLNESERLYELTLALDPGCLGLLRGLAFEVSGASGAEIIRVEPGELWSSQALHIIQDTEGCWGVGITETTESELQQAPGMALARIVFRAPEEGLDQSSLGSIIVFRDLRANLTSGQVVGMKSPLELESAQEAILPTLPKAFSLSQNAPNPFNPSTTISYSVPEGKAAQVGLRVYDVRGRSVRTLVEEFREAGTYRVSWDGTDGAGRRVSSGVYFYRIRAGEFTSTRKMVLLK